MFSPHFYSSSHSFWTPCVPLAGPRARALRRCWPGSRATRTAGTSPWSPSSSCPCRGSPACPCSWMWVGCTRTVAQALELRASDSCATLCLFMLPRLILHRVCADLPDECADLVSFLNNLNWSNLSSLSFLLNVFSSSSLSCRHYSVPTASPSLPLPCSTFILLSPVFRQCLPRDSGFHACKLRGFWILRKFVFKSSLPTVRWGIHVFYQDSATIVADAVGDGWWGGLFMNVLNVCVFVSSNLQWLTLNLDSLSICGQFCQSPPGEVWAVWRVLHPEAYRQSWESLAWAFTSSHLHSELSSQGCVY